MSRYKSLTFERKGQKTALHVVDHTNINDFFSQPSAQELTAAFELRVQEVIEDLKRRTVEEMENWSSSSRPDERQELPKSRTLRDSRDHKSGATISEDVVSIPVSFVPTSPFSPSAESNSTAVSNFESDSSLDAKSARYQTFAASQENELLRRPDVFHESTRSATKIFAHTDLSNTATSQTPPKFVPKSSTPTPLGTQGHPYQYNRTQFENLPAPTLTDQKMSAAPLTTLHRTAEPMNAFIALNHTETSARYSPFPQSSPQSPQHAAGPIPKHSGNSLLRPQSPLSSHFTHAQNHRKIKRKPLPAKSPLLLPHGTHPALRDDSMTSLEKMQ